jgi:hypothetical protein
MVIGANSWGMIKVLSRADQIKTHTIAGLEIKDGG